MNLPGGCLTSGAFAKAQPFRWSTKFTDAETDLVNYGRRPCSPGNGHRWHVRRLAIR